MSEDEEPPKVGLPSGHPLLSGLKGVIYPSFGGNNACVSGGAKSNVIHAPFITRLPIPVARILEQAGDADLTEVIVIGTHPDGSEYFASSSPDGGDILWLLERMKLQLLGYRDE